MKKLSELIKMRSDWEKKKRQLFPILKKTFSKADYKFLRVEIYMTFKPNMTKAENERLNLFDENN